MRHKFVSIASYDSIVNFIPLIAGLNHVQVTLPGDAELHVPISLRQVGAKRLTVFEKDEALSSIREGDGDRDRAVLVVRNAKAALSHRLALVQRTGYVPGSIKLPLACTFGV